MNINKTKMDTLYIVVRGNSDKSIMSGDLIWFFESGKLGTVLNTFDKGFFPGDDLKDDTITDFKCKEALDWCTFSQNGMMYAVPKKYRHRLNYFKNE